jgi:nitrogen fixation NifU-like protein
MDDLRELYQEVILEHNRTPRNFEEPAEYDRKLEGFNPLCGDKYTLYLKMDGEQIDQLAFTGSGCAISKASASIMCADLQGKTMEEARARFDEFLDLVTGESDPEGGIEKYGRIAAFAGVREFPVRIKCATLAWHCMKSVLEGDQETVTTE